jgi:two-component system LytT family response regulator
LESIAIAGAHDGRWTAAPRTASASRASAARQNGSSPPADSPEADASASPSPEAALQGLTAAVVHGDAEARRGLLRLLTRFGSQVTAVCDSGCEALQRVPAAAPDILYVAVQMRGMDGFELLEALGSRAPPVVVFVSPRQDDAVRAFDTQAVDYLLEPVTPERFLRSLRRAEAFLAARRVRDQGADAGPPTPPPRVEPVHWMLVDHRGASIPLQVARIGWIEASDNYVKLHVEGQTYLIRESMARIITRLDPTRFVRIHRSVIVNMEAVKELHPTSTGDDVVVLKDGTTLRMSRRYARQLGSAIADYR